MLIYKDIAIIMKNTQKYLIEFVLHIQISCEPHLMICAQSAHKTSMYKIILYEARFFG